MIVTTYTFDKSPLHPTFYFHTTCAHCDKPIFNDAMNDEQSYWLHTFRESEYCKPQYGSLAINTDKPDIKAVPVFGPFNLELMWQ